MYKMLYPLCMISVGSATATELPQSLHPLVVTATRTASPLADVPASITVIDRAELLNKGSSNLFDALQDTPGITLQGIGSGGRKSISLRGLEGKHSLILLDGKRLPGSNDSLGPNTDYQYDWLPLEQIERVEIVRGPMSVLYGADALGGVVNIITRKSARVWTGQAKAVGYLSDGDLGGDGHQLSASASGAIAKDLTLQINALQTRREAVAEAREMQQSALEGREQQQFGVALEWQIVPEQTLKLEHSQGQEDRWYDTVTRRGQVYQSRYDIQRRHTALGWDAWFNKVNAQLRAYENQLEVENSATQGIAPTDPQTLQQRVFEAGLHFPVMQQHLISMGAEYQEEQLQHPKLLGGEDEARLLSGYAQDDWQLSEQLRLTLGTRYDRHDTFGTELSPRIALGWGFAPDWTARASYGHGFRSPNIKQIAQDYRFAAGMFLIQSNPDLQPETNNAWELGIHYTQTAWELDAVVFDNRVKNMIDTHFAQTLNNGLQLWVYDNIAEARLRGAELAGQWTLLKPFSVQANYQYLDARDGDGTALERRPRHTFNSSFNWQQGSWQARLSNRYTLSQNIIPPRSRNRVALPNYGLWDLHVRKTLPHGLSVAVGIENLMDVNLAEKSTDFRHEVYPRSLWLEVRGGF